MPPKIVDVRIGGHYLDIYTIELTRETTIEEIEDHIAGILSHKYNMDIAEVEYPEIKLYSSPRYMTVEVRDLVKRRHPSGASLYDAATYGFYIMMSPKLNMQILKDKNMREKIISETPDLLTLDLRSHRRRVLLNITSIYEDDTEEFIWVTEDVAVYDIRMYMFKIFQYEKKMYIVQDVFYKESEIADSVLLWSLQDDGSQTIELWAPSTLAGG